MASWKVQSFAKRLDALQASASISLFNVVSAALGHMRSEDAAAFIEKLELAANDGDTPRRAQRFKDGSQAMAFMESVGAA